MAVVADILSVEKARLWRGAARSTVTLSFILLLFAAAFAGLVFIVLGGYLSLASVMEPWQAGGIVGGGMLLLVAIVLSIVVWLIGRHGRKPVRPPFSDSLDASSSGTMRRASAHSFVGAAVDEMLGRGSLKLRDVIIGAVVAGLVLGASPNLRQRIFSRRKLR